MEYLQMIFLGIIQGATEWLPISSEAMVALTGRFLFSLEYPEALGLAVWLHLGTAFAASFYFWDEIVDIVKSVFDPYADRTLLWFIVLSSLLTLVVAVPLLILAFSVQISDAVFTLAVGIFLAIVALVGRRHSELGEKSLRAKEGIWVGVVQGLAALPGVSRSGVTITALLFRGFSLTQAFRLSFLMSIPVTFGVQVILPLVSSDNLSFSWPILVGALSAAVVGFLTIRSLITFARRTDFFKATMTLAVLIIVLGLILL